MAERREHGNRKCTQMNADKNNVSRTIRAANSLSDIAASPIPKGQRHRLFVCIRVYLRFIKVSHLFVRGR
jgi:hypothetical protein